MRAVLHTASGVATVDVPEPAGDGVRVHITSAGICGSDLHMLSWGPGPLVLGHEFGGVLDDGRPVAVQPYVPCGACAPCRSGREHLCRAMPAFAGVMSHGGMAERAVVDPSSLVYLPPALDPGLAALVEPVAVVLHGANRLGDVAGRRLLVIGGGTIGLLAVAVCRRLGASVDLAARHGAQVDAGSALGAGTALGEDYDVVVDAAGTAGALEQAGTLVSPGGTILELGTFWEPTVLPLAVLAKEVQFVPSFLYGHHHGAREFDDAAALLAELAGLPSVVVTHRYPLERAGEAFRTAADRGSGAIKVLLAPGAP